MVQTLLHYFYRFINDKTHNLLFFVSSLLIHKTEKLVEGTIYDVNCDNLFCENSFLFDDLDFIFLKFLILLSILFIFYFTSADGKIITLYKFINDSVIELAINFQQYLFHNYIVANFCDY
ncbi:Protein of unknown function [Gryllus bimaculatus]|nr:Protein of unknown function [Gryllus bimaculatus]